MLLKHYRYNRNMYFAIAAIAISAFFSMEASFVSEISVSAGEGTGHPVMLGEAGAGSGIGKALASAGEGTGVSFVEPMCVEAAQESG